MLVDTTVTENPLALAVTVVIRTLLEVIKLLLVDEVLVPGADDMLVREQVAVVIKLGADDMLVRELLVVGVDDMRGPGAEVVVFDSVEDAGEIIGVVVAVALFPAAASSSFVCCGVVVVVVLFPAEIFRLFGFCGDRCMRIFKIWFRRSFNHDINDICPTFMPTLSGTGTSSCEKSRV